MYGNREEVKILWVLVLMLIAISCSNSEKEKNNVNDINGVESGEINDTSTIVEDDRDLEPLQAMCNVDSVNYIFDSIYSSKGPSYYSLLDMTKDSIWLYTSDASASYHLSTNYTIDSVYIFKIGNDGDNISFVSKSLQYNRGQVFGDFSYDTVRVTDSIVCNLRNSKCMSTLSKKPAYKPYIFEKCDTCSYLQFAGNFKYDINFVHWYGMDGDSLWFGYQDPAGSSRGEGSLVSIDSTEIPDHIFNTEYSSVSYDCNAK